MAGKPGGKFKKDLEAFARVWHNGGTLKEAKLAARYSPAKALQGRAELPPEFLAVLKAPRGILTQALESAMEKRALESPAVAVPVPPAGVESAPAVPVAASAEVIRPSKAKNISDAYREILTENPSKIRELAKVVIDDGTNASKARDRLSAVQEVTDRLEGKATQRIDTRGVFVVLAPESGNLAELDAWADGA